jgi:two-component system sensor histidine kinase KdpD
VDDAPSTGAGGVDDGDVTDVDGARRRGELRLYFGAAPGAGKTFAMLSEAHRRLQRGTDVVAAVVETHGRGKVIELLGGIETVGAGEAELDIAAVLARRPQVALVDDFAHTNGAGGKNDRRWQDVEELLEAGITVISTVDVAHLESLREAVAKITGTEAHDTVPDSVVRQASQIELIDITPQALRRRLSHGNIYAPGEIDATLSNYFRVPNLAALRELALLWLADRVETLLARYRADADADAAESRERVVVAVTGGPESATLLRRASSIASKAGAELMVVHVLRGDGPASEASTGKVRELAAGLNTSLHIVVGDDVATALLDFAREVDATQLVMGASRRSRWARLFDEGIGAAVVRASGTIDVHIVTHPESRPDNPLAAAPTQRRRATSWLAALAVPCLFCALTVIWLERFLKPVGISALFFSGVLLVAMFGGVAPAVLSAVLSSLLLNYYMITPRHALTIAEPDAAVTEVVLLLIAVAVAVLVDGAAQRTREARRASEEAELLTLFAGSVLRGADLDTLLDRVRETYSQRTVSMLRRRPGADHAVASVGKDPPAEMDSADTVIGVGDDEFWMLLSGRKLATRDRRVLSAVAKQAAGLIKQRQLAEEASRAEAIERADELRRSLLSAVSHDLRTPLAAAKVSVSSLRADDVDFSPEDTAELLTSIEESIDQLTALVGNLLDSSRLAAGVIHPELRRVYLEEVVQRALISIGQGTTGFFRSGIDRVGVDVDGGVVLADAGLLERVLANLIDNALRYAPDGVVRVNAGRVGDRVLTSVIDEGRGIPHGTEEDPFAAFQRLGDHDNTTGVGLGLSVARGFVEAMGGTVTSSDTPGGGLTVTVDLAAP